jgi:hypothetical protein
MRWFNLIMIILISLIIAFTIREIRKEPQPEPPVVHVDEEWAGERMRFHGAGIAECDKETGKCTFKREGKDCDL